MGCLTKAEVTKLLGIIAAMYPRFEVSELKVQLWVDMIGDISFPVAQAALKKVMMTSEFPPNVAQIRKAAVEVTTLKDDVLDAGKAWGEVQQAISKWGWPEPEKAMEMMSPLTRQVVKQISWREICLCEEPGVVRGQFVKMYSLLQKRIEDERLLPDKFKEQMQAIAEKSSLKMLQGDFEPDVEGGRTI